MLGGESAGPIPEADGQAILCAAIGAAIADGILGKREEEFVRNIGLGLGLSEPEITAAIDEELARQGATREPDREEQSQSGRRCPQCGAGVSPLQARCRVCGNPLHSGRSVVRPVLFAFPVLVVMVAVFYLLSDGLRNPAPTDPPIPDPSERIVGATPSARPHPSEQVATATPSSPLSLQDCLRLALHGERKWRRVTFELASAERTTLSGRVRDDDEKRELERLVSMRCGVSAVDGGLETDVGEWAKEERCVSSALTRAGFGKVSATVKDDHVILRGEVDSDDGEALAVRIAESASCGPVIVVSREIRVAPPLSARVEQRLHSNRKSARVTASVAIGGEIILSGRVFDDEARSFAEREARQVPGVASVENRIETVTDQWKALEGKITQALADGGLSGIGVNVTGDTVNLKGQVANVQEAERAVAIAKGAAPGTQVYNFISVRPASFFGF